MIDVGIVHIIDDDASLRRALERLMLSVGLECRSYGPPLEFLEISDTSASGCIVLDIRMPGINGLDFQRELTSAIIHLPVIVMSGYGDIAMSVRAMKAGAVDFLAKPFRDQDMLDAVEFALDKNRRDRAIQNEALRVANLYKSLSPRERQTMKLVTSGLMNKQIAFHLDLSEITVKIHRKAVMRKTGASSLAELVRMAEVLRLHRREQDGCEVANARATSIDFLRPANSIAVGSFPALAMVR